MTEPTPEPTPWPNQSRLLCLCCGTICDYADDLMACPNCGCSEHTPADPDDTVTVTISRHELRILTFWSANFARHAGEHHRQCVQTIVDRLGTQTDTALSLSHEIADVRAAYPEATVQVFRDGELTDD